MNDRLAAVIPALNEATAIGDLVRGLRASGACCVYVVDGGSSDGTPELAATAGAKVVYEARRGYGHACLTGAEVAQQGHQHHAVAFLDGDGSCDPSELPRLRAALPTAELVLGWRRPRDTEAGAMPLHARLGNVLVAAIITLRTGRRVRDLPPFKVVRSEFLKRLNLDAVGYGWTVQLISRAATERSARIREVPVRFLRRRGGVSKVAGRLQASGLAAIAMVRTAWTETAPRPIIAIVAKAPRAGEVKTRLIQHLGGDGAAEMWSASLVDTAAVVHVAAADLRAIPLIVARASERAEVAALVGPGWRSVVQGRPGLDGAIATAFETAAKLGTDRALVVSGDNPDLPPGHLAAAFRQLDDANAVLGPTEDGGYHLVGLRWRAIPPIPLVSGFLLRRFQRRVRLAFDTVPMGSDRALDRTHRALRQSGFGVAMSPTWPDVDTSEDLRHLVARLGVAPADVAPRTRAWLKAHDSTPFPGGSA
ncbi:MAG: DUF2064 domain-containing protein [Chloroflexi bacterium]|nr:DUF2064 domain-containing protein [Chloroflexota bacterium]